MIPQTQIQHASNPTGQIQGLTKLASTTRQELSGTKKAHQGMQRASSQIVENPNMLGGGEMLPNIVNGGYDA